MDTKHLEYLRRWEYSFAVAKHMSFARAAQQLHIRDRSIAETLIHLRSQR